MITKRYTKNVITYLEPNEIFVFGSNEAGVHGAGAARDAVAFGARYGHYNGFAGQTYGIPTKDRRIQTLPLSRIEEYVDDFLLVAAAIPHLTFLVTPIGCGLAGYEPSQIGPMFKGAPPNVVLPACFQIG